MNNKEPYPDWYRAVVLSACVIDHDITEAHGPSDRMLELKQEVKDHQEKHILALQKAIVEDNTE